MRTTKIMGTTTDAEGNIHARTEYGEVLTLAVKGDDGHGHYAVEYDDGHAIRCAQLADFDVYDAELYTYQNEGEVFEPETGEHLKTAKVNSATWRWEEVESPVMAEPDGEDVQIQD